MFIFRIALMKKREDINNRAADMWSYSVLLWELATREVPFADMSAMEIGMKVREYSKVVQGRSSLHCNATYFGGIFIHF